MIVVMHYGLCTQQKSEEKILILETCEPEISSSDRGFYNFSLNVCLLSNGCIKFLLTGVFLKMKRPGFLLTVSTEPVYNIYESGNKKDIFLAK